MERWTVELADEFEAEFNNLHEDVSVEILALSRLLQEFGPQLGTPSRRHTQGFSPCQYERVAV